MSNAMLFFCSGLLLIAVSAGFYQYFFRRTVKYSAPSSDNSDVAVETTVFSQASPTNIFPFIDRISYFLASNDEKGTDNYVPTALQDTDPNNYA